ncbi:MAG: CBS domain-containing protein [Candidatus Lokiarchaeota archaeon]|nr:CBS domain-containing protein [Candidatus Lokiarchaeota archaeon]
MTKKVNRFKNGLKSQKFGVFVLSHLTDQSNRVNGIRYFLKQQQVKLYILGSLTGAISGCIAVVFRYTIFGITQIFSMIPQSIGILGWVIIPAIGGLISGILFSRYPPETRAIPEVMESYSIKGGKIRPQDSLITTVAAAVSIGSGGSCGREGPIAQLGAGAGSALAQRLKLDRKATRTLLVCGLSSGVAATFGAPLGGSLFGIEILVGELTAVSIVPVILASVIGVAIAVGVFGAETASFTAPEFILTNYAELILFFIMGLAFGILSKYWVKIFYWFSEAFERIKGAKYGIAALGGLLTGIVAAAVIVLEGVFEYQGAFTGVTPYVPAIMGSGYGFINATLLGTVSIVAMITFGLIKMLATSLTIGSGGGGGVFAPTLFIGAGIGGAFGYCFELFFPEIVPFPMAFALVGMAAMFSGAAHVPVTCIVMTMEMTGDYGMILPLMIAVSSSYILSSAISPDSIYTEKLRRKGVNLKQGVYLDALRSVTASQVMTREPVTLRPDMLASEALDMIYDTRHTKFPVVLEKKILGTVIAETLEKCWHDEEEFLKVFEVMDADFLKVLPDTTIDEVLHRMLERDEGHAVVVDPDDDSSMIGFLTKTDVLRAYESAITELRMAGKVSDLVP